jgi:hypothetical protein
MWEEGRSEGSPSHTEFVRTQFGGSLSLSIQENAHSCPYTLVAARETAGTVVQCAHSLFLSKTIKRQRIVCYVGVGYWDEVYLNT